MESDSWKDKVVEIMMKTNKFEKVLLHTHIITYVSRHQQAGRKIDRRFFFSYKNEQHRKLVSKGRRERERERWLLSKEQKMKAKLSMKAKIKQHVKVAR